MIRTPRSTTTTAPMPITRAPGEPAMTDTAPVRNLPNSRAWLDDAACLEYDSEMFYPTEMNLTAANAAINICDSCDVRLACLISAMHEEATAYGGRHGIRGGLTPTQRMQLAKGGPVKPVPSLVSGGRKVAECGTDAGWYRHKRTTHTDPCGPCRDAHNQAGRKRKGSAA